MLRERPVSEAEEFPPAVIEDPARTPNPESVETSALKEETNVPGRDQDRVMLVMPTEEKERETGSAKVIPESSAEKAEAKESVLTDRTEAKRDRLGRSPETVTVAILLISEEESVNEETETKVPPRSEDDVEAPTRYVTSPAFFSLKDTEKEKVETDTTAVSVGTAGAPASKVWVVTTEENPDLSPPRFSDRKRSE